METIKGLADYLILIIPIGVVLRVVYCLIRMGMDEEEAGMYKKRIRNAVIFLVIAVLAWELKDVVSHYYK